MRLSSLKATFPVIASFQHIRSLFIEIFAVCLAGSISQYQQKPRSLCTILTWQVRQAVTPFTERVLIPISEIFNGRYLESGILHRKALWITTFRASFEPWVHFQLDKTTIRSIRPLYIENDLKRSGSRFGCYSGNLRRRIRLVVHCLFDVHRPSSPVARKEKTRYSV